MSSETQKDYVPWDVDNTYRRINSKGRWQVGVYLLHCGMYTTLAYHYLAFIFIVDTPAHHCKIPPNATKNETIPKVLEDGKWVDARCHMYVNLSESNATMKCPNGWEFDPNSGYISTIVTDFELVCGKNIMVEISLMISNAVLAICQVFATRLADTFGRKPIFLGAMAIRFLAGVGKAFSPNMITYIIMDALLHVAMTGFTATLLVMSMELFPTEYRSLAGTSLEFFWFLSLMLCSLMVYLFRNWRVLEVVLYAPMILGIAYYWLIDESVPWLMATKRYAKAEKIIRRGAKFNKVALSPDFFQQEGTKALPLEKPLSASKTSLRHRSGNLISSTLSLSSAAEAVGKSAYGSGPIWVKRDTMTPTENRRFEEQREQDEEQPSIMDVFKSRKMVLISVINFLLWFCNSMVYSALNLTVTYLSGDRYLNFILLNLAELPAIVSFHFALNKYGRRWPICIYHMICGVALLLTLVEVFGVNAPWLGITLNFVGKFAITASYCAILVYAPELYPTNVRSMFFGLCWFCAYIAQIIAPYCRPMEAMVPGLVRGACGALSLLVGFLVLLLPETFMRPFPKTISEIEGWTRTVSKEERQRYKEMAKSDLAEAQA